MNEDIKHEAAVVAEKVGPGLAHHQVAAYNVLFDEVNAAQSKLTPAQNKHFNAELSKDLAGPLRGVQIVGMEREFPTIPRLELHTDVGTDKFSKYDLPRMTDYLTHNWVRPDGTSVQQYDGDTELVKIVGNTEYRHDISHTVDEYNHYAVTRPGYSRWTYPDGHYGQDSCDKNDVLTQIGVGSKPEQNYKRVYSAPDICKDFGKYLGQ